MNGNSVERIAYSVQQDWDGFFLYALRSTLYAALIALSLAFLMPARTYAEAESAKSAVADPPVRSYLVVNADTGDIIMKKNADFRQPPASLAKIMTLYLAMEEIKRGRLNWDKIFVVPKAISRIGGSEAKMWHGEKISVRDLFKAAAVGSANDAAAALALIISGSEKDFVARMNAKALSLGLSETVFRSAHGLPVRKGAEKDRTTARDMAKLALAVWRDHPEILKFTSERETYIRGGKWRFFNTNKLIGKFPGMNGLKTGFTNDAGFCLVATVKRENLRLVSVVLGADSNKDRFKYTAQLLKYVYERYTNIHHPCKGKTFEVPIMESEDDFDTGIAARDLFFMARRDETPHIRYELFIPNGMKAPIPRDAKIAEYVAVYDNKVLARVDVLAKGEIRRAGFWRRLFGS